MALIIGVLLAVFQQVSGINAILYYAPEIFKYGGASTSNAFAQTIIIGATNLIFTVIAISTVDSFGRKKLLIIGNIIMTVCLVLVGLGKSAEGIYLLLAVIGYVAAFSLSVGPVTWVVISEIFPNQIRGTAMSVATAVLWFMNWIVTQTFPVAIDQLGHTNTFLIFACMGLLSLLFVIFVLPETKGKSLEEISMSIV
jgi:SP family arabinose:H+ symporter-like MFS transporter